MKKVLLVVILGLVLFSFSDVNLFFKENAYSTQAVSVKKEKILKDYKTKDIEEGVLKAIIFPSERDKTFFPSSTKIDKIEKESGYIKFYFSFPDDIKFTPQQIDGMYEQVINTFLSLNYKKILLYGKKESEINYKPLGKLLKVLPPPKKHYEGSKSQKGSKKTSLSLKGVNPFYATAQPQPSNGLVGKFVFLSAGHGWTWDDDNNRWYTQRPNIGNLVEDYHNGEIVDYYLARYFFNAGAHVYTVRERDPNRNSIIVDNTDLTSDELIGTWYESSYTGTANWGTGVPYLYTHGSGTSEATAKAIYAPNFPADGYYAVYVWFRAYSDRSPTVRVEIHHDGGTTIWTLNQQRDGSIWKYIGTYYFKSGKDKDNGSVIITNAGSPTDKVIIADAVRFGGGIGDSGYARADENCIQYATFNKAPSSVTGSGDVWARPRFAEYMREDGDDGIYISNHTNAYNGTNSGTSSFAYSSEGWDGTFDGTPGSLELRDSIHSSIVNTIRDLYYSSWHDRGTHTNWYVEINPTNLDMPGTITEIAFHDDMYDGSDDVVDDEFLQEPDFRQIVAKAIYVGALKYFEQRDNVDLTSLPEPPTNFYITVNNKVVTLHWTPPQTIILSNGEHYADAATGYKIYKSLDGWGWDNGIYVAGGSTTSYSITSGLHSNVTYYFKITAVNDGGESFPTEVLAVRFNEDPKILIVNGFDRLDRGIIYKEYVPALANRDDKYFKDPSDKTIHRCFIEKMNSYNYITHYAKALEENNYGFTSASNEAVKNGNVDLNQFDAVIWILGQESTADHTFDSVEQQKVEDYLNNGGNLFVSGSEIGWDLDYKNNGRAFFNDYLKADYVADSSGIWQVEGIDTSIFSNVSSFSFDDGSGNVYKVGYPDVFNTSSGSSPALLYSGTSDSYAAIQYSGTAPSGSNQCKIVTFGFPFETILDNSVKTTIMEDIMQFFGVSKNSISVENWQLYVN